LEVQRSAHPVTSLVSGRILRSYLSLGRVVEVGELLLELDSEPQQHRLEEEAQRAALRLPQIQAMKRERRSLREMEESAQKASAAEINAAEARLKAQRSQLRLLGTEAKQTRALSGRGIEPKTRVLKAEISLQQARAELERLKHELERRRWSAQQEQSARELRLLKLEARLEQLRAEEGVYTATQARLEQEIEERRIRAPVAGRLAEHSQPVPGEVLLAGQRLAAVIPEGSLRIVAEFPPGRVLGRLRPGQTARMRLVGFPWAQYGSVKAQVERVAEELHEGLLRVELSIQEESKIPLQHGMPGRLEIAIEQISPLLLLLRAAGSRLP